MTLFKNIAPNHIFDSVNAVLGEAFTPSPLPPPKIRVGRSKKMKKAKFGHKQFQKGQIFLKKIVKIIKLN